MLALASTTAAIIGLGGLFWLLARSVRPRVKLEPWPVEGARFRTHIPLEVTVRREWPMDSCEATLAAGVELVASARPEGAAAVTCEPISDSEFRREVFVGRPAPRDAYYLSVKVEQLRACCVAI